MRFQHLRFRPIVFSAVLSIGCSGTNGTDKPDDVPTIDIDDEAENDEASLCESQPELGACGEECILDGECGDGFHCNASGSCDTFCTAAGEQCDEGRECNSDGRCVFEGTGEDECPDVVVEVTPTIPTVIVLVDRSGSMDAIFEEGETRWDAVKNALTAEDGGVLTVLGDRVRFGTTLYNSAGGGEVPAECPILHTVTPTLGNVAEIRTLFDAHSPDRDTPTGESVLQVAQNFPASDGPKIIVLATDGDPDTCGVPNPQTAEAKTFSEEAVQTAFDQGIETYVLSVGSGVALNHLQRVANAGRGADLGTGLEPYFVANDNQQMVTAFNTIIRGARSCEFALSETVTEGSESSGTVVLNGALLEFGTDWQLSDASTLELVGTSCSTFKNTDDVALAAEFPCDAVVIE